ncbi:MAG: hypothetical protein MJ240_05465 [Kiritimatiellae bacterium]|nr:hypothetical protein [Kiritimatiellia bacterium]
MKTMLMLGGGRRSGKAARRNPLRPPDKLPLMAADETGIASFPKSFFSRVE